MIKLLLLDIDGVMTNGKVCIDENGCESKQLDFQDIDAIFEAKRIGLPIGFISGENSPTVNYFQKRFDPDYFITGCKDKKGAIKLIANESGLELIEIAYVGDSHHDHEAIKMVGLGMCPANSADEIKRIADRVLLRSGGNGAVSEAVVYIKGYNAKLGKDCSFELSTPEGLENIEAILQQHNQMITEMLQDYDLQKKIDTASATIGKALRTGKQIFLCGNGGSAADAQHLATELVSRFYHERRALNAEALTTNTSSLTAIANDYNFNQIFARQIEARANKGDVLIGLTTSGNSTNVIEAFQTARNIGVITIAMTGNHVFTEIEQMSDITIKISSQLTPRIQEGHILVGHLICELVEKQFLKD